MGPIRVGVDLGQSHIRIGALVHSKYIVAQGTKDIKVNDPEAPDRYQVVEIFRDANDAVKSYFDAPKFEGAVVVVPNSTSDGNKKAIADAGDAAGANIIEIITENTAVAAAYAYKVNPTQTKSLAIVSLTAGELDVSIFSIISGSVFFLETIETHPEPVDLEEDSRPGGPIGLAGEVVGAAVKKLLSDPKFTESPADEVVFVGKGSKSEKMRQAVKERFPDARIWSPEDIQAEELPAYGAAVMAFERLTPEKREPFSIGRGGVGGPLNLSHKLEGAVKAIEADLREQRAEEYRAGDIRNVSKMYSKVLHFAHEL